MAQNPIPIVPGFTGAQPVTPTTTPPPEDAPPEDAADPAGDQQRAVRAAEQRRQARQDVVDLLVNEHRTIASLVEELASPHTDPQRQRDLADVIVAEVTRHVTIERRHLVPTVRDELTDGDEVAEQQLDSLSALQDSVAHLDGPELDRDKVARAARALAELLDRHVREQEQDVFSQLRDECRPEQLRELAQRARSTRHFAPTRAHPHTPDQPPWSTVSDPVVGAADKVRDEVTGRLTEPRSLSFGSVTYPRP